MISHPFKDAIFELKTPAQKGSSRLRLLMVDNYDSFTFNLVQYFAQLGAQVTVKRNDELTLQDIEHLAPDRLVISPGPCSPKEAGISMAAIHAFGAKIPTLGVCLGHQSIGAALGAEVVRAKTLMHGKTSRIEHLGLGVFKGLPSPLVVNRYHSLAIQRESCPPELEVTAWSEDGEIMGVKHKRWPLEGVQFHPESILSEAGHEMLENYLLQR